MDAELDPRLAVFGQIGREAIDRAQDRQAHFARQRGYIGFLDRARGVVGRELQDVALRDARHAAIADVDRLVEDEVQSLGRQSLQMGERLFDAADPVDELAAARILGQITADIDRLLAARREQRRDRFAEAREPRIGGHAGNARRRLDQAARRGTKGDKLRDVAPLGEKVKREVLVQRHHAPSSSASCHWRWRNASRACNVGPSVAIPPNWVNLCDRGVVFAGHTN
ncbi:MAG: hypothetical protein WDN24_06320 [Sphingomonas sp.]